jgi:hypothetical protein
LQVSQDPLVVNGWRRWFINIGELLRLNRAMADEEVRQVMREATEAERIGEYWTVTHAEKLLPTFDGNPKEVRNFILTVNLHWRCSMR